MTAANPFWIFSNSLYSCEGVEQCCLRLQNEHAIDVNVLLYVIWCACQGQQLQLAHLEELEQLVDDWRQQLLLPLREIRLEFSQRSRQQLSQESSSGPDAPDMVRRLLQLELKLELHQQNIMHSAHLQNFLGVGDSRCLKENLMTLWQHAQLPDEELQSTLELVEAALTSELIDQSVR